MVISINPRPRRSVSMKRLSFAPLIILSLAGCSEVSGPEFARRLAVIEAGEINPVEVEVPTAASQGVGFEVAVTSYGGGCTDPAGTDVEVSGLVATVEPYQLVPVDDDTPCPRDFREARHVAQVRFDQAGTGTIRFRGVSETGDAITVERTVVVQ
jgi:hypothetical protein